MSILDIADYYIKNLNNSELYNILSENIRKNCSSVFNQINVILKNKSERQRAIDEIKEELAKDEDTEKNTRRFTINEIAPLQSQQKVMRFQTEDLIARGMLRIRTETEIENINPKTILCFRPEEQNLIITLVLEHIIDSYNKQSYAYTLEYLLLFIEEQIVHKLTPLDGKQVNVILLASIRTLLSYIIADAIFNNKIENNETISQDFYNADNAKTDFFSKLKNYTIETYIKHVESREEFEIIKEAFEFMNQENH